MILKKKEFFLLIFLILLQSCSGGRVGNFLESSFNDLEKISQDRDSQKNLENQKSILENQKINNNVNEKIKKVEKQKSILENQKINNNVNEKIKKVEKQKSILENQKINNNVDEKIKKVEKQKSILENKKDVNFEKIQKQKNKRIKNSSKKRKIETQSYKIIFILKNVDPKDPIKEFSTILRNSEVNFEIEKIERILDSKNKSMNKN